MQRINPEDRAKATGTNEEPLLESAHKVAPPAGGLVATSTDAPDVFAQSKPSPSHVEKLGVHSPLLQIQNALGAHDSEGVRDALRELAKVSPFEFMHRSDLRELQQLVKEVRVKHSGTGLGSWVKYVRGTGVEEYAPQLLSNLAAAIAHKDELSNKHLNDWLANPASGASELTSISPERHLELKERARELAAALHKTPKGEREKIEALLFQIPDLKARIYEGHVDNFLDKLPTAPRGFFRDNVRKNILNNKNLTLKNTDQDEARVLTTLPSEIGELDLKTLSLDGHDLTTLPPEIGNLKDLEELRVNSSGLTRIPPEVGQLKKLTHLGFWGNQLSTLPPEIGQLSNLRYLDLGYNQFTRLPPEIAQLRSLDSLHVNNNQLAALPSELSRLNRLRYLSASQNQLNSLPDQIGQLRQLQQLYLQQNQMAGLPASIANLDFGRGGSLQILDLSGNPVAAQAENERTLGRAELRRAFRDRVVLNDPLREAAMPSTTTSEEVYRALDAQPQRINRANFQRATLPELPIKAIEDGEQLMEAFARLYSNLNLSNEKAAGYLGPELVSDQDIPRLSGYLKTLYGLPLTGDEQEGWQMYDAQKPAMKKALSYILDRANDPSMDPDQRAAVFFQFLQGMLYCPSGQKEGIDTVAKSLLSGEVARSSDLPSRVNDLLGIRKNSFFKTAVLSKGAENTQNVHLLAHYEDQLREELGLSNVLGFSERIGVSGTDPFSGNKNNVLKVFYDLVTPQRLADWVQEKTPSAAELGMRDRLAALERKHRAAGSKASGPLESTLTGLKKRLEQATGEEREMLQARIAQMERILGAQGQTGVALSEEEKAEMIDLRSKIRQMNQFKPLTPQLVLDYLRDNKIIDTNNEDWWKPYFSSDPIDDTTAALTRDGALKLLQHLGYVQLSA